jgi:hypothetical protein
MVFSEFFVELGMPFFANIFAKTLTLQCMVAMVASF